MKHVIFQHMKIFLKFLIASLPFCIACADTVDKKRIVFAFGGSVHLWGDHENKLMSETLAKLINSSGLATADVFDADSALSYDSLKGADAVVIISEGENRHPFKDKMEILEKLNKNGTSIGAFHYALDFGSEKESEILGRLIGGFFEQNWSVNPAFQAEFKNFADHPTTRGVKPFEMYDEWYFNIRFPQNGTKVIPTAQTIPPDYTRKKSFGPHSGNKHVRDNLGAAETIAWISENENGTCGFGFTGGHALWGLYNDNYRKLLINSILWIANIEIPEKGVDTTMPPVDELAAKIVKPPRPDYEGYFKRWRDLAAQWQGNAGEEPQDK